MSPSVYCFLVVRNEAKDLHTSLSSLQEQTLKPTKTVVVNDGSTDSTKEIAESFGCQVIDLPYHKENYLRVPNSAWKLSRIFNVAFYNVDRLCHLDGLYDYYLQMGHDLSLPINYIDYIAQKMEENHKLVIASGQILGDPTYEGHVRGGGRIYRTEFWDKYIKRYPVCYSWESYPLFKADQLGFKVKSFPELAMSAIHRSMAKGGYGYGMRELGYFPPFALGRCLKHIIHRGGREMLLCYLKGSPFVLEPDLRRWVRQQQVHRLLNIIKSK